MCHTARASATVSDLSFNSQGRRLSFSEEGPENTSGYTKVYIAKSLIEDISDLKVVFDGKQTEYTASLTDDSWLLYFTYQHSTHQVEIDLGELSISPFNQIPLEVIVMFGGVLVGVVALLIARAILVCID